MERVEVAGELEWLARQDARGSGRTTGFDRDGWPASTWVLHAMYETATLAGGLTHDEAHRMSVAAGASEPSVVGDVNLHEIAGMTLVGSPLGRSESPGPGWTRLMWRDLARRTGDDPFQGPPCVRSFRFPTSSWPVNIRPPAEGSLDREQFSRVCEHLAALDGDDGTVLAYYARLATSDWSGGSVLFRGSIAELAGLYDDPTVLGSPSNIWSQDRSWFVYTDHDLWGTKVSGSPALIATLSQDPNLETADLPL